MKKLIVFLGICLVLAAAAAAVLTREQLNRRVVRLHNGHIIAVDRAWEADGDLYYETNKEVHVVRLTDIKVIEKQSLPQTVKAAGAQLIGYLNSGWNAFYPVVQAQHEPSWLHHRTLWMVLASAAAPAGLFFFVRSLLSRRARRSSLKQDAPKPVPAPKETAQTLPNRADVVRFFLNLYRQQVGAGPEVPAEFSPLSEVSSGSNTVYELRVRQGGDWVRRRMTIGSLGDEGCSKSKCFYVIFDKHIVVKIPPKPIRTFEDYVAGIQKEGHIVERLAPKECIIPRVSVILDEVHPLPADVKASSEPLEEKYLAWLRDNPQHQACLKIKDTFVYFMDLSRYYFLSRILDSFRDLDETLRAEFSSVSELVRYPSKFKERYGQRHETVGFEIRDLYHQCEAEVRRMLKHSGNPSTASDYRIQRWFVNYLEKREIGKTDDELSPERVNAVASIFAQRFEKYREPVKAYMRLIRGAARRLSLEQNRLSIAGIIAHLLDSLAWLDVQKVAMRDLKPDNLLVAGDPHNYPAFLRSPAEYSLGFIDIETAVYFGKSEATGIRQPLLGGTPFYATPSHLFPNSALEACFGDACRILHFQDWQAVLAMIFNAVTGEILFSRTAQHFAEIKSRLTQAHQQAEALEVLLEDVSRRFWRSAAEEFREKMRASEKALRFVETDLSKPARALFVRVLTCDIECIREDIQTRIATQTWFTSPANREQLLTCSRDRTCRIMEELQAKSQAGAGCTASIRGGIDFVKDLAARKALAERKAQAKSRFESGAACRMNAYDLLVLMFGSVLRVMVPKEANSLGELSAGPVCEAADTNNACMATTVYRPPEAPARPGKNPPHENVAAGRPHRA